MKSTMNDVPWLICVARKRNAWTKIEKSQTIRNDFFSGCSILHDHPFVCVSLSLLVVQWGSKLNPGPSRSRLQRMCQGGQYSAEGG